MIITIYGPDQQGVGGFDGGKITEQKPIGFPGDGAEIKRVGPLFYWAWAFANEEGFIGAHPHQAFEIMTYVVHGKAEHGDSLGTKSVVGPGGAQVMQTGSGVYHEERFIGPDMEGFQIWFEPYLNEAVKRTPTYNEYSHGDFPIHDEDGVSIKTVIGEGSPVELVTDVSMWDIEIPQGKEYQHTIKPGHTLCALAIRGGGEWTVAEEAKYPFEHKDFTTIQSEDGVATTLLCRSTDETLRLIAIETPTKVDYPLYRK